MRQAPLTAGLIAILVTLAVLAEHHTHLGESSWPARGGPDAVMRVEDQLLHHEWLLHLGPALWANGRALPEEIYSAQAYRVVPPYLHALAWAATGSVVRGLILLTDLLWIGAALCTMSLAHRATGSRVCALTAGLLVAVTPGFLGLAGRVPHLGAAALVPLFWLTVVRTSPFMPAAPWTSAALAGLLLAIGGHTYDVHIPLLAWLLLTQVPEGLAEGLRRGTAHAALGRMGTTLLVFALVYGAWLGLAQLVLFRSVVAMNQPGAALLTSWEALRSAGIDRFLAERLSQVARLAVYGFTWPVLLLALFGPWGLRRRDAWQAIVFVGIFFAAAALTKSEERVIFPAFAAIFVLAVGGLGWLSRVTARRLGDGDRQEAIQSLLAVALTVAAFVFTHAELWGDYTVIRAW